MLLHGHLCNRAGTRRGVTGPGRSRLVPLSLHCFRPGLICGAMIYESCSMEERCAEHTWRNNTITQKILREKNIFRTKVETFLFSFVSFVSDSLTSERFVNEEHDGGKRCVPIKVAASGVS